MPMESKSTENIKVALCDFVGTRHGKLSGTVHSDRAKELIAGVDQLRKKVKHNWVHSKATPHRPTSRGVIEREIGVVLTATRGSLAQSGFPLCWWPKAVRYQCFALNVTDDLWSRARGSAGDDYAFHQKEFGDPLSMRGKLTAYERRHGEEYTGLRLPRGCAVRSAPRPRTYSKTQVRHTNTERSFRGLGTTAWWSLAGGLHSCG